MSINKYIKEKENIDITYQMFKDKNNINIKEELASNNKIKQNIFKSKPFKLSIALTILLLVVTLTVIGVNHINKPKYQEYNFTEEEIMYMNWLGASENHPWVNEDTCYYRDLFLEHCCSLYKGKISNQYYIVGYLSHDDKLNNHTTHEKFNAATWYIFNNKTAPYKINKEKEAWLVIKYLEITYTEDITTGYQFEEDLIEINYLGCNFRIDEKNNVIEYEEIEYQCSQINDIFLRKHGFDKVYNEKDLEKVKENIEDPFQKLTRYMIFSGSVFHDSREAINDEFYNLIAVNEIIYMQVDLYEVENGEKKELNHIKRWGELGEQLTQIKEGEIVSEDGRYIMGLYPLDEVRNLVLKFNDEN